MKKKLVLIGAGNVCGYLAYNIHDFPEYEITGILDDDIEKHHQDFYGLKVLGGIEFLKNFFGTEISVAICIHDPVMKFGIFEKIKHYGFNFPNFISPKAWVSHAVDIGIGSIIYPGVSINYESRIGNFVSLNMNCALGHHSFVEDFVSFAPGVNLGGHTTLLKGVNMGIGASTLQGVTIGEFSIIAGNSIVIKDVPSYSKVIGVPGKVVEKVF
ncbi:MAG: NeuD/PglB/VioB family sugar acetyltransferase [Cecembia sp.]